MVEFAVLFHPDDSAEAERVAQGLKPHNVLMLPLRSPTARLTLSRHLTPVAVWTKSAAAHGLEPAFAALLAVGQGGRSYAVLIEGAPDAVSLMRSGARTAMLHSDPERDGEAMSRLLANPAPAPTVLPAATAAATPVKPPAPSSQALEVRRAPLPTPSASPRIAGPHPARNTPFRGPQVSFVDMKTFDGAGAPAAAAARRAPRASEHVSYARGFTAGVGVSVAAAGVLGVAFQIWSNGGLDIASDAGRAVAGRLAVAQDDRLVRESNLRLPARGYETAEPKAQFETTLRATIEAPAEEAAPVLAPAPRAAAKAPVSAPSRAQARAQMLANAEAQAKEDALEASLHAQERANVIVQTPELAQMGDVAISLAPVLELEEIEDLPLEARALPALDQVAWLGATSG